MGKFIRRLLVLALVVLAAVWFWDYENNTIQTDLIQVHSSRLPEAFRGLRVAVVSDLHGRSFGPDNEELLAAVAGAEPDLIAVSQRIRVADRSALRGVQNVVISQ